MIEIKSGGAVSAEKSKQQNSIKPIIFHADSTFIFFRVIISFHKKGKIINAEK